MSHSFGQRSQGTETTLTAEREIQSSNKVGEFANDILSLLRKATGKVPSQNDSPGVSSSRSDQQKNIAHLLGMLDKVPIKSELDAPKLAPNTKQISSSSIEMLSDTDGSEGNHPAGQTKLSKSATDEQSHNTEYEILKVMKRLESEISIVRTELEIIKTGNPESTALKIAQANSVMEEVTQMKKELQQLHESLTNEKQNFKIKVCEWEAEKRLLIQSINLERKECAMLKSSYERKQRKIKQLREELEQQIQSEKVRIQADTLELENEQREFALQIIKLQNEKAALRKNKLTLQIWESKLANYAEVGKEQIMADSEIYRNSREQENNPTIAAPPKVKFSRNIDSKGPLASKFKELKLWTVSDYKEVNRLELDLDRLLLNA